MQRRFIEPLEKRQLLSASPATQAYKPADVPHVDVRTAHPETKLSKLEQVLAAIKIYKRARGLLLQPVSGGQVLSEPANFLLDYLKNTNPTVKTVKAHPASKGAVVSTTFQLRILSPSAPFSSFPTVYKFTLNAKNPLALFSFKKKDAQGDTLTFTGTLSANFKKISGVVNVQGPNRSLSDTYSVTLSKT